ncbi:MAG: hypothetical protein R3B72_21610 [Polyangiaceae bacterium]
MKRRILRTVLCLVIGPAAVTTALGCSAAKVTPRVTTGATEEAPDTIHKSLPPEVEADLATVRTVGDFVVYRFSGSYRKAPVEVSHTIIAKKDHELLVDVTITDGGKAQRLRLRTSEDGEVLSVARWDGNTLRPFGVEAYEDLMAELTLAADENLGLMSSKDKRILVGGKPFDATVSRYRVRVGARDAVLESATSSFSWGDVGGEIRTLEGEVLYKAEVIDAGQTDAGIAATEEGDVYEGYDFMDDI